MNTISTFVILYPVIVSIVWIVGSIFYSIQMRTVPLRNLHAGQPDDLVSVLIPGHNEQDTLASVVESVSHITYSNIELVLINDGSQDNTLKVMHELANQYQSQFPVKVVNIEVNRGKANALNVGAQEAAGTFLLCLDADCYVDANVIQPMLAQFYNNAKVGAVAGKPIVRNRTSILGRLELLEYVGVIDIIKRGQAFVTGHITTVSGVVVAYRKAALEDAGWWNIDAITEDIDITWRLYHHGWQVIYCPRAVAWILVPERIPDLINQRRRWARGGLEVLFRNREMLVTGRLSEQWLLLDMVLSDLWVISCSFVTLFYLFTVAFTGDLIMDGVILFLLLFISLVQFLIGYADSRKSDFISWQDLLLLPLYVIFYWFINLVSCLTSLGSFFLDPRHVGSWRSPDRGALMMKKASEYSRLIIRKRAPILTMLRRAIILIALWLITGYVIYINVCFLLNAYSDTLVADYLLLNLSLRAYQIFALLVVVIATLMIIFGWLRIHHLKRRANQDD